MAENKIQLIIEALDRTKAVFAQMAGSIRGIGDETAKTQTASGMSLAKLEQSWIGVSAKIVAGYMAIRKAFAEIEVGAKARQTTDAFRAMAGEMGFDADKIVAAMRRATAETIDDSDLMQKALTGITQGIKPDDMARIAEMARAVAVKRGIDVSEAFDRITDAIANKTPRALRQMGLLTKEATELLEKAAQQGITEVNMLSLVIAQHNLQLARMGGASATAQEGVQKFKAEMKDLRETVGGVLLDGLMKLWDSFKGIGMMGLLASAAIWKVVQAERELRALVSWGANKAEHLEVAKAAGENARADLEYAAGIASGKRSFFTGKPTAAGEPGAPKVSAEQAAKDYQAELDKAKAIVGGLERAELEKKALAATLARYKAEADAATEANKTYIAGRKLALEQGLIDQKTYLDDEAKAEEDAVRINLAYLAKREAATLASYRKQKEDLAKAPPAKLAETKELEATALAEIRGETARAREQLLGVYTQGRIDAIEYSKKLAAAERDGELAVMTEIARIEIETNRLRAEAGEMKAPEALRIELDWETRINEKKRANLALDAIAATDDSQKKNIEAQIAVLDKGLRDINLRRLKLTEADKKAAADQRAVQQADIQARVAELDIAETRRIARPEAPEERVRLARESVAVEKSGLDNTAWFGNEAAWYAQLAKLNAAEMALANTERTLAAERTANREADIQAQLAELDIAEASGTSHRETLEERIRLTTKLIGIQEDALKDIPKAGNETAWYAQADKVNAARKAFAELNREILMKSPFGAISLGLKDVAADAADVGTKLYDSIRRAFDGMTDALTDFVMTGKLSFADLAQSIIRDLIRIQIQQQITGPLASGAGGLLSLAGAFLGGGGGASSWGGTGAAGEIDHAGGTVGRPAALYRVVMNSEAIPRRHAGGLAPDERTVINKVGERYVTKEQNDWLTAIARQMDGGQAQGLTIHVPVNADVGSKKMISELRSEIEGTVVRVIKKHS